MQGVKQLVCLLSVGMKTARSQDSGIMVISKFVQVVNYEKPSPFCFLTLGTCHEHCKSYDYIGHAYRPLPARDHVHNNMC